MSTHTLYWLRCISAALVVGAAVLKIGHFTPRESPLVAVALLFACLIELADVLAKKTRERRDYERFALYGVAALIIGISVVAGKAFFYLALIPMSIDLLRSAIVVKQPQDNA